MASRTTKVSYCPAAVMSREGRLGGSVRGLRRAPHGIGQLDVNALHLAVRRIAQHHSIIAGPDVPVVARSLIGRKQPRIDRDLESLVLSGLEIRLGKCR